MTITKEAYDALVRFAKMAEESRESVPVPQLDDVMDLDLTGNMQKYLPWMIFLAGKDNGEYICKARDSHLKDVRDFIEPLLEEVEITG